MYISLISPKGANSSFTSSSAAFRDSIPTNSLFSGAAIVQETRRQNEHHGEECLARSSLRKKYVTGTYLKVLMA
jgi:hypothetical protein